jgi:hypothetical protein
MTCFFNVRLLSRRCEGLQDVRSKLHFLSAARDIKVVLSRDNLEQELREDQEYETLDPIRNASGFT